MLDSRTAQDVISAGCDLGASFVDIYVERTVYEAITLRDSEVKDIKTGTDFGIGIRAIFGNKSVYGYTNIAEKAELLRILHLICEMDKTSKTQSPATLSHQKILAQMQIECGLDRPSPYEEKIAFLRSVDKAARKNSKVTQFEALSMQKWQAIQVFDSEGLAIEEERHAIRIPMTVIAADGSKQARAFVGPGGSRGWELAKTLQPDQVAETLVKRALTVLHADPCPAGKMPVVIDNGFGGVIFHEACGHLLETTSVEKKASVFHDRMGEQIASSVVSAVDDGTIPGLWGSLSVDDEGMPTQRTQLIKDGRLTSFLVDRLGSLKTGFERTGSARRQSYKFAPASRMRNTFIDAGKDDMQDMIASIPLGLYAKVMGGGSVNTGTGDFNFAVEEAYIIKDGKVGKAVRGATLIGSGPQVLKSISMVGSNLELSPGMCGSVSGSINVCVGQPSIKVDEILVGGEA